MHYNAGTISFTTTNSSMVSTTIPDVTGSGADTSTIAITNRTVTITATRLLNQSIDAKVGSVLRTLSRTSTPTGNAIQTISGILMDNVTDASTNTLDLFDGEGYRLKDNTYTTWLAASGSKIKIYSKIPSCGRNSAFWDCKIDTKILKLLIILYSFYCFN